MREVKMRLGLAMYALALAVYLRVMLTWIATPSLTEMELFLQEAGWLGLSFVLALFGLLLRGGD